jgi:hypothetical protein
MAVTIDPRPTVFGDRVIITGTYAAADTSIDLSDLLASIDFAGVNSAASVVATTPPVTVADTAQVSDTTITVIGTGGTTAGGTFLAIGRRS